MNVIYAETLLVALNLYSLRLHCRTRKCIIIALILIVIFLYLWPSRLMFGRSGGQQFLMPHKWLSATSHPLSMKSFFITV